MYYLINIILGIIYFVCGIILINKVLINKNIKHMDIFFLVPIVILYVLTVILSIKPCDGFNLQFVTPLSNFSPFLFTLSFVVIFLPENIKTKFYRMFCLFFLAMFIAGILSNLISLIRQSAYFWFGITDEFAHITFSLWCYYLLKSKRVELKLKDLLFTLINIYIILFVMIILNLIFKTSFFGLNFYGHHNIYGFVITQYGWLSNLIYIISITMIIFVEYYFCEFLKFLGKKKEEIKNLN